MKNNQTKGVVLIVDDQLDNLRLLSQLLSERGYSVRAAKTGIEALSSIQSALPDLVLLDIRLPDISGYEVCARLKSDEATRDLPVLFLSALKETDEILRGFAVGAVDYITKPFQAEEVLARVKTNVEMKRMRDIIEQNAVDLRLANKQIQLELAERKRAEAALRRNEHELQEKNAELIHFSHAVSHDLKSPLVTILAFLGYLEKDIQNQNTVRIDMDIGYIRTAAEKMGRLLDELRDLSRIGRVTSDPVEMPLQEIVQEALALVAGRITEKNVRIQITEEPVVVFGDRSRLVEVFQNLIDNAVKFMGDQAAPCIEIGAEKSGDEIVLFVRDNGIGIDPRHQEKIFGLFEKLDPQAEGTGMGLSLVKRIVEVHGGGIRVESEGPGNGACFRFTLAGTRI